MRNIWERVKNRAINIHTHFKKHKKHYHLGILWTLLVVFWAMIRPQISLLFADDIVNTWANNNETQQSSGMVNNSWELMFDSWWLMSWQNLSWNLLSWDILSWDILTWWLDDSQTSWLNLSWTNLSWEVLSWNNNTWDLQTLNNSWTNTNNTWNQIINTWANDNSNQITNNSETMPTITWLTIDISPQVSWYVWLSGIVEINFSSNKILTWFISTIYWTNADEITNSWLDYKFKLKLTKYNLQNSQTYNIYYQYLDWNSWNIIWTWPVIFDKIWPEFNWLDFTWNYQAVTIKWATNEKSLFQIKYSYSWQNTLSWWTNMYATLFDYILTWLDTGKVYNFSLSFLDIVNNVSSYSWNFYFDLSWNIRLNYIVDSGYQGVATWNNDIFLLQEIKKFSECKEWIKFTDVKLPFENKDYTIKLPTYNDANTRKIISELSYDIVTKIQQKNISDAELEDLFKKFNNFILIIKLVKDDDNACKQNFSLYYISRFQKAIIDVLSK